MEVSNNLIGYKYQVEMKTSKLDLSYEEVYIPNLHLIVDDTGSVRQSNLCLDLDKCTVININDDAIEKINTLVKEKLEQFHQGRIERQLRGLLFADSKHSITDSRAIKLERIYVNKKRAESAVYKQKLDEIAVKIEEAYGNTTVPKIILG